MKLSNLKQQLKQEYPNHQSTVRRTNGVCSTNTVRINNIDSNRTSSACSYNQSGSLGLMSSNINYVNSNPTYSLDNLKIIGITGSRGKSTTAYIVHQYLKSQGYKSILYSSIKVESLASYASSEATCERPLGSGERLLSILEEAESLAADFLVLEVNETAIAKGLTKDIPFTIRALTNLEPKHNLEFYREADYVNLKKAFFENVGNECISVLGLTGELSREEFNQFLNLSNNLKITFGSKYISEQRNANYTNLDCLLYDMKDSLEGLKINIRVKDQLELIKTKLILPHNALNITCSIAILEALGLYNTEQYNQLIKEIKIPGRETVIKVKNRTVIIGLFLLPSLEVFKKYQTKGEVKKISVVSGATGSGYLGWKEIYHSEEYKHQRSEARRYACRILKDYADKVYLTSNDSGAEDPNQIALEMQSYLNGEVESSIIVNRYQAIKEALLASNEGDIIYIAGRGNKLTNCISREQMELFNDQEQLTKAIKEIGW